MYNNALSTEGRSSFLSLDKETLHRAVLPLVINMDSVTNGMRISSGACFSFRVVYDLEEFLRCGQMSATFA